MYGGVYQVAGPGHCAWGISSIDCIQSIAQQTPSARELIANCVCGGFSIEIYKVAWWTN